MNDRDALIRKQYEREAERGATFAERMRARGKLHAHGWGDDPWADERVEVELARSGSGGAAEALADAGRALLANDQLELLERWLLTLTAASRDDQEAISVVRGMLSVRSGDNERAAEVLAGVPHPEAVALHGLALLQLRRVEEAASRLEILLAADSLDEHGELEPTYLPEPMPVLALFLSACAAAAELHLGRDDRARAQTYAMAAGDALRRYTRAEAPEGPSREEVSALIQRCLG